MFVYYREPRLSTWRLIAEAFFVVKDHELVLLEGAHRRDELACLRCRIPTFREVLIPPERGEREPSQVVTTRRPLVVRTVPVVRTHDQALATRQVLRRVDVRLELADVSEARLRHCLLHS